MEMNEIIEQAKQNIRDAIADYRRYTDMTQVLDDITPRFIERLAKDSAYAKQDLRELFSQSPVWDSKLDALVINGTRTHNPDYAVISRCASRILRGAEDSGELSGSQVNRIIAFFAEPEDEAAQTGGINLINQIAPKAYAPGKKKSRIFKALCEKLNLVDDTAGSEFQRLYAQFADELTAKKIAFKLYVSINPAHFITMSNPKGDSRGTTLTSCHSFNSTEYEYNNGCTGYARDKYSFIVFTASDPKVPETLNNRKTTRQIFAYKPGNGLLLQSRFYNTSGGTHGAVEDAKLYRDLVQREISAIEGVPNLWSTYNCCKGSDMEDCIEENSGFAGYPDWIYPDFNAKVSIRTDCKDTYEPLVIGARGICVRCGGTTQHGVYCEECEEDDDDEECCEDCDDYFPSSGMYTVYDIHGRERRVCPRCCSEYYALCGCCDCYISRDRMNYMEATDEYYCDDCLDEYCECCANCVEYFRRDAMSLAVDPRGREIHICKDCAEEYELCAECGRYVHSDDAAVVVNESGEDAYVCPECLEQYSQCEKCECYFKDEVLLDGICPGCAAGEKEVAI